MLLCMSIFLETIRSSSIRARTPSTPTTHTLHPLALLHLLLRYSTDTRTIEIRLLRLYTPQATQLLISLLLPLCNQHGISVAMLQ